jgi:proline iminopeptidase
MRILKLVLIGLAAVSGVLVLAGIGLYFSTNGVYPVAATVSDDPGLERIEIAGIGLHSRVVGAEDAPVIVVLHGGPGGDFHSLEGFAALANTHRVVFYDQRGAGLSQRVPAEALTLDGYLAELDGVIEEVSPEAPVTLIGHSWGAMLASAYLGQAPDKVSRAVLIEPGFLDAGEMADWMAKSRALMLSPGFVWSALVAGFEAMHVDGPDAQARDDYQMGKIVHAFTDHPDNAYHCPSEPYDAPSWRFGALASRTASATPPEELDRLALGASFPRSVLFIAGACDTWIGPDLQAKHAARFANARLAVIDGAGHEVLWDQPEATLAEIRSFLAE